VIGLNTTPEISQGKLDWLNEIGAKRFETPMNWHLGTGFLYSDKYITETPLEELKAKYDPSLVKPARAMVLVMGSDGTTKEAKVGIEHLDRPETCDFLFNAYTKTLMPTRDIFCKGIQIILDS
jgi:hypothetical protein